MPTRLTPIRLTTADRAKVEAIRERYGLPSAAAAIRYAVETVHRGITDATAAKPRAKAPPG